MSLTLPRGATRTEAPSPPSLALPMSLIVLVTVGWALMLNNGVFIDESLYIRAGRAYLDHWLAGTPLPADVGTGFSGLPMLYPVLAAALDMVGGLALVRAFSLLCVVATMFVLRAITAHLFTRRAGLVAAAMYGLTGPVLYIGHLGTFDAVVILMLSVALWLGLTRSTWAVVLLIGPLLALTVATKFTAYVFVPPILVLITFNRYALARSIELRRWRPRPDWDRVFRSLLIGVCTVGLLTAAYAGAGDVAREGLAFTTTERKALSPASTGWLVAQVPDYVWPMFFAALLGTVFLGVARRWTAVVFAIGLLGTALLLPVAQIKLGEAVSFQKHLAYSAMFLAPLAGWGFARPWRLAIWTPVLVWWLILVGMWGMFRSHDLIAYPDVRPVVQELEFGPGEHLSSSAESLAYYTLSDPSVVWQPTSGLYAQGPDAVEEAIEQQRFATVVIHAGATGSTIQDEGQQVLLDALEDSDYTRTDLGEEDQWLVYRR